MVTLQVLHLAVTCSSSLILVTLTTALPQFRQNKFEDVRRDNLIFNEAVVFDALARSRLDCARLCSKFHGCQIFTFVEEDKGRPSSETETSSGSFSSGSCRGNSDLRESGSTYRSDAKTFRMLTTEKPTMTRSSWLRTSCRSNEDCPGDVTVCHNGHCLCLPVYYFSYKTDRCVETCPNSDLGPAFVKYEQVDIDSINTTVLSEAEVDTCVTSCLPDPDCRYFLFPAKSSLSTCFTGDSFRPEEVMYSSDWDLHVRTCA